MNIQYDDDIDKEALKIFEKIYQKYEYVFKELKKHEDKNKVK
jgi:hypothetical protein